MTNPMNSLSHLFVTAAFVTRNVCAIWAPEQVSIAYGATAKDGMTTSMHVQWVMTSDSEDINGVPFRPQDSLVEYWEPVGQDEHEPRRMEKVTILSNNGTRSNMTTSGKLITPSTRTS